VAGQLFHLEIGPAEAARWQAEYADEWQRYGHPSHPLVDECRRQTATMYALADRLMDNFLRLAAGPPPRSHS
jgi:hypothetical protein